MAIIDSRQTSELQNMSAIYGNSYDNELDGIQTFLFRGDMITLLSDLIIPLAKAETTLTHLRLVNSRMTNPLGQSSNISQLHFPHLTRLELIRVYIEPDQWVAFFAKLQAIEYVMLHCISIADRVLLSFCHLPSLKRLNLCVLGDGPTVSQKVLLKFADTLADVNSSIDSLELGSFWNLDDQVLEHFARISQLSKLSVSSNYRITLAGAEHFCASNLEKPKSLKLLLCANVDGGIWTYNESLNLTSVM
ncbi:hypothetical protein BJV82DRAFT_672438 [Fennellomyces sp. T-0311]|nr:hypothetical protein BJV82DRAFT_672438 [Fennellomyces sp. T-0311]